MQLTDALVAEAWRSCVRCGNEFPVAPNPYRGGGRSRTMCVTCLKATSGDGGVVRILECQNCGELFESRTVRAFCTSGCKEQHRGDARRAARRGAEVAGDATKEVVSKMRREAIGEPCPDCGTIMIRTPYRRASAELDHIIAVSRGGGHNLENLRFICRLCNIRKSNS